MKLFKKAQYNLIVSMIIFGTIGLFVRNISLASSEIALYRAILAIIFIVSFLIIKKETFSLLNIKKQIPILALSGIAMGFNWILLFEAYKYTTVSIATLSYYFAPVLVTLAYPFLFKEKMTKKNILCFIMSTIGIVLITGIDFSGNNQHMIGILYGLSAAILYAFVVLTNKFIKDVEGLQRTLLQFIASAIILIPYISLTNGFHIHTLDISGLMMLLIIGFIHTGIAYCLYFTSLKDVSGQQAALLSYIDPLVAVIISITILGEPMGFMTIIGGLLILGFTLYNELT